MSRVIIHILFLGLILLISVSVILTIFTLIIALLSDTFGFFHGDLPDFVSVGFELIKLLLTLYLSYLIVRIISKRLLKMTESSFKSITNNRYVMWTLMIAYILTLAIGIPAVQSSNNEWAIEEYKKMRDSGNTLVREAHPYIKTFVSLPILPFIVVSYHEYQLTGLYGWGGWDIQLWYFIDTTRLFEVTSWIS